MGEKAEATPGPWAVRECIAEVYFEIVPAQRPSDSGLFQIADVCSSRHGLDGGKHIYGGEQEANAHMLAASRDMYDALEATTRELIGERDCLYESVSLADGSIPDGEGQAGIAELDRVIDQARAAIAKAKGEQA